MRRPRSRWGQLWVLVGLLALVLAGCTGEEELVHPPENGSGQPVPGGIFLEAKLGDATLINPILTAESVGGTLVEYLFDSLVTVDAASQVVPQLATEFQVSPDQLSWTFILRQDVSWHDGEPFSAADVRFTLESILHPYYLGPFRGNFAGLRGVHELEAELYTITIRAQAEDITPQEERELKLAAFARWQRSGAIETPDPYTVSLHLDEPFAPFLLYCGGIGILPQHLLADSQGEAMNDHPFNREPVGTGRFRFQSWQSGEHIVVERNVDWWGTPAPAVDQVVVKIIPEWNTLELALEAGELDLGPVQHESAQRLEDQAHLHLYEYPRFSYTFMGLNMDYPPFREKAVRQALAYAIDQPGMVDAIFAGRGTVAATHGSPARWDYNPHVRTYPHDPDRARELLRTAGWETGDDGVWVKGEQRLSFTLHTHRQYQREAAVVIIQENLRQVGIEVELVVLDWPTFVGQVLIGRQFDAAVVAWNLGPDPDAYSIWHTHGGMYNFIGYSHEPVDSLLEEARRTLDQERRLELYWELQAILAEEQPYVFLFYPSGLEALNCRIAVTGSELVPSPAHNGNMTWNLHHWWIPAHAQKGPLLSPH